MWLDKLPWWTRWLMLAVGVGGIVSMIYMRSQDPTIVLDKASWECTDQRSEYDFIMQMYVTPCYEYQRK